MKILIADDEAVSRHLLEKTLTRARRPIAEPAEQFLVLVECADEAQQTALLERFQAEGLKCRALLS